MTPTKHRDITLYGHEAICYAHRVGMNVTVEPRGETAKEYPPGSVVVADAMHHREMTQGLRTVYVKVNLSCLRDHYNLLTVLSDFVQGRDGDTWGLLQEVTFNFGGEEWVGDWVRAWDETHVVLSHYEQDRERWVVEYVAKAAGSGT